MELHWKDDLLHIIGIPKGYRYFLAKGHQPAKTQIPENKHLANAISDGSSELSFRLPPGDFLFRARLAGYRQFEYEGNTDNLPLRLVHKRQTLKLPNGEKFTAAECIAMSLNDPPPDPDIGLVDSLH